MPMTEQAIQLINALLSRARDAEDGVVTTGKETRFDAKPLVDNEGKSIVEESLTEWRFLLIRWRDV